MQYGYALVYKDKDGFTLPCYQKWKEIEEGVCIIFNNETAAKKYADEKLLELNDLIVNGKKIKQVTKKYFFFNKEETIHTPCNETELLKIRQIINTLTVKKVKIA